MCVYVYSSYDRRLDWKSQVLHGRGIRWHVHTLPANASYIVPIEAYIQTLWDRVWHVTRYCILSPCH